MILIRNCHLLSSDHPSLRWLPGFHLWPLAARENFFKDVIDETSSLPCSSFNLSPPGDGGPTSQTPPLTSQQGQHPYCMLPFLPSWELRKRRDQEHWRHQPPRAQGLPTVCHGVIHAPQICSECMEPRSPRFNPCPLTPFPQGCRQALSRPLPVKPSPLPCLQPGRGHVPV